jgi:hypothetical protein
MPTRSPPGILSGLSSTRSRGNSKGGAAAEVGVSEDGDTVGELPGGFGGAQREHQLHSAVTKLTSNHPLLRGATLSPSARRRADAAAGAGFGRHSGGSGGGATGDGAPDAGPRGSAGGKDVEMGATSGGGAAVGGGGGGLARISASLASIGRGHMGGGFGAAPKAAPLPKPMKRAELRRMREVVAIKTFSTLVQR